jgi:UDP-GlcNAc:undecaprenyl-phosphate GlcNAc-1-phosphate transferase
MLLGFLAGSVVVTVVGVLDDVRGLGAKAKLAAQVGAATIAWLSGARISTFDLPGLGHVELPLMLSYAASVFWIVAFVNAINLIDGLDGLAGGLAFFAAITNLVVAVITDNALAAAVNAALGGAVLGFLFYNFNPATIFMGDTGSMFLGFVLGGAALLTGRQKESTLVSLLVPVIALGLPVMDTILAMLRRALARRSIFAADREHIHHRLLDLGLTHRRAVLILYGCTVLLCAAAVGVAIGKDWEVGAALVGAVLTLLGIARFAGYFEWQLQRRGERAPLVFGAAAELRRALPALVVNLTTARNVAGVWARMEEFAAAGKLEAVEYTAHGEVRPLWQWRRVDDAGPAAVVSYEVPVRFFPGAEPGRLLFRVAADADDVVPQTQALLQVAADVLETALTRVNADQPAGLIRRVRRSTG